MKVKWLGVVGLAMMGLVVWGGIGLYFFKDRLVLTPVVVTIRPVDDCSPIPSSALKVIGLPQMGIPPGTARSLDELQNKWTVCGYSIPKNGFVYISHTATEQEMMTENTDVANPDGSSITIQVDETMRLWGRVNPGEVVDFWFVSKKQTKGHFVGKLFNNIRVLDVKGDDRSKGQEVPPEPRKGLLSFTPVPQSTSSTFITFELKEVDIPYFLSARQEGTLVLVGKGKKSAGKDSLDPLDAKEWLKDQFQREEKP